ncbi:MAG: polysaccharide deacetylase family protein [Clostridia bacterium]|nr:polysaccharide deacetylase family protein [Clostridia bacterium]
MKRIVSFLLSFLMIIPSLFLPVSAKSFTDVSESDWFYPAVTECVAKGYMVGTSDTVFSPDTYITRAQLCQVLYNISGETGSYSPYFTDVGAGAWYAKAVCWAKNKGIAAGTSDDKFSPHATLTREQLAVFYSRYVSIFNITLTEKTPVDYVDADEISTWAEAGVAVANNAGLLTTRTGDCFIPRGSVTRAELAGSLLRLKGDYENGVYDTSKHVQLVYNDITGAVLEIGATITIKATIWPADVKDTKVTYTSSAPAVASVDENGKVTALSHGKTYITSKSSDDGHTATTVITVNMDPNDGQFPKATVQTLSSSYKVDIKPIGGRVIDPNKPMVAITYDDGPRPKSTNRILDCLEKYGAVATFFELGYLAKAYPDCIRREVAIGCEVANHSWDHPNLATLSGGGVANQINSTNDTIFNICGVKPKLLRPPYGSYNQTVRNNAGLPLIIWSIDTLDWKYRDASYVTSVVKNQVTDGSVILMHSIYDSTAAATEAIVPWLISQGYQLVTVSELAEARGIELQNGGAYHSFYKKK